MKRRIARWTIRFEFTNRYINLVFRAMQLAMFCEIFKMNRTGYIITGLSTIVLFVAASWILDKTGMIHETQSEIWERTPQWQKIKESIAKNGPSA